MLNNEQLKQVRDALESCAVGGYRDVDGDWCERKHFDTDKVAAALSIIRTQEAPAGADAPPQPEHVCGLQGFGALGDECPACALPSTDLYPGLNVRLVNAPQPVPKQPGADALPKQFTDQELGKSFEAEMSRRRDNVRGADALQALVDLTDAFHEGRAVPLDDGSVGYVKSLVDAADTAIATAPATHEADALLRQAVEALECSEMWSKGSEAHPRLLSVIAAIRSHLDPIYMKKETNEPT